ncbi:MAG: DUF1566 domain-containing protein [Ignavibacteria bacterium]|nr:DUF1566 domain-containing protein [Ignavibacteria bacterium]
MNIFQYINRIFLWSLLIGAIPIYAQIYHAQKLPDTGQITHYTSTFGEDADYLINSPAYKDNGNGTITDNVTGLMWQKQDAGEMTYENAILYCDSLTLAGYTDWILPNCHDLFSLLNHDKNRPAMDTLYFTKTSAEYWWSSDKQIDDAAKIWVVNAGGGVGAHPKTETISAGGTKYFQVRAVRGKNVIGGTSYHFIANGDSTLTDVCTGLMWTKFPAPAPLSWEDALKYSENLTLSNYSDWRLPNVKELQSINIEQLKNPSFDSSFFKNTPIGNYWSSTTLFGQGTKAWYINSAYGLGSYDDKTKLNYILCVRGPLISTGSLPEVQLIPGGVFVMGDHHGYVDPSHPSDELPLHTVHVDSFYIGTYDVTNAQFCSYLNSAYSSGLIEVRNGNVYAKGDTNLYCYTAQSVNYSSIGWNGSLFSITDFRANHPMVGVMWLGAAAYCNWASAQAGLPQCYNLSTGNCNFTVTGYRLPTEAEWEYAGRGGQYNPYFIFPWGNDTLNFTIANWPSSGDPYETGNYPYTTPVGFYNGSLRLKTDFNWPGSQTSYQTSNGANPYGLYDMAGNVWQFVNDWYGQNYYSVSPYDNPKGPTTGFIMPDGKPYRGMRGGNWYNGQWGHSRVANRNPSYYRGPQDPNHPWYHVGFRVARYVKSSSTVKDTKSHTAGFNLLQNYPNPFNPNTTISCSVSKSAKVTLKIFNTLGQLVCILFDNYLPAGSHQFNWNAGKLSSGIYYCTFQTTEGQSTIKMILMK